MKLHPGKLMFWVWGLVVAAYIILPFRLVGREFSPIGFLILLAFIALFIIGSVIPKKIESGTPAVLPPVLCNSNIAERLLMVLGVATVFFLSLDIRDKSIFDLALTYELRSAAADALINAESSQSSLWFQIAFLLYPAGFVFVVVHNLFAPRISLIRVMLFGFFPVALATLSMGGRAPIFYCFLCGFLSWRLRQQRIASGHSYLLPLEKMQRAAIGIGGSILVVAMTYYFSAVFVVRAAVAGGASEMFDLAEDRWNIAFDGALSTPLFAVFGPEGTYLMFVFVWYLVQGLVLSVRLFAEYEGPLQFGVYGVDLVSALMRRLDPQLVVTNFDLLLTLNVMGFLPSAFGSLYVDLSYFGALACLAWGYLCGLTYQRIRSGLDERWLVFGPVVTLGIVFSVINTPIGFTNGLVTHWWLLVAFAMLRRRPVTAATPVVVGTPLGSTASPV